MTNTSDRDPGPYPKDHLFGIIEQPQDVHAAVEALVADGFDRHDVIVLCGPDGVARLDPDGTRHGPIGRLIRLVQNFGPEREQLRQVQDELQRGHFAVGVHVANDAGKQQAAEVLKQHAGRNLRHYGQWEIEALAP